MSADRPNILLLFTDMQRADTLHALGNETIRTPALDRLVHEGVAFTRCFSPSPVCVPARCCLHYGQYPQRTNLFDNGAMMPDNGRSYPALLGAHGYRTHAVGKCHFTPDRQALRGFQSRRIQEEITSDPARDEYVAWLRDHGYDTYEPHGARGEMYYIPQISSLPAEAHPTQWVGDQSLAFLREAASDDRPWCLFTSFIHPHPPFAPPKPWHKLYRAPDMPLPSVPEGSSDLLTWINRYQNRYKHRDAGIDRHLVRAIKASYYATISFVDYQVGRILHALEESGQLDRTLILFTSDHGEYLGDYHCFGKRGMHDASARVPLVVRYPTRFVPGSRSATAASLVDVLPTLLAAAGLSLTDLETDGIDLAELAAGGDGERIVYSQFSHTETGLYMAASAEWKYIYSAGDDREFVFDRRHDPLETRNLADAAPEAMATLKQSLLAFLQTTGRTEASVEAGGNLDWKRYPRVDESYLQDPDARLLFQDYPPAELDLPGYSD